MPTKQRDLALLDDPIAQALLHSQNLARVAIRLEWVGILDSRQCFPSALERALEAAQAQAAGQ